MRSCFESFLKKGNQCRKQRRKQYRTQSGDQSTQKHICRICAKQQPTLTMMMIVMMMMIVIVMMILVLSHALVQPLMGKGQGDCPVLQCVNLLMAQSCW